jgi:isoprenylcysteine carboxyl methyltransferase (ICMT) family protein YpbQ
MLSKKTVIDKIETCQKRDYYILQVREKQMILDDGAEISSSFFRYILYPDHDINIIAEITLKAVFEAVMTDDVKEKYQAFKLAQEAAKETEMNPE